MNRYLWGAAVDQLLADEQYLSWWSPDAFHGSAFLGAGPVYWPLTDHLGTVRDLVDSTATVREHQVFDSFGNLVHEADFDAAGNPIASSHQDAVDAVFGYTGRPWDSDVQLQYNRARWYSPTLGRWLNQDPISFAAGDANLYRYVGNGPTTKTDPSGLEDEGEWTSLGGYNPWAWNFPLGQKTVIGWLSGGWSATSRANELARQERTFRRQQAINDPCSQYAVDMQQTYRATPSELRRMREFAETGIQFNAMVLGGGALRPSALGLVDDLPLRLPADTPGGELQKIPYMLEGGKLRRYLSGGKLGSFKGQRIDFIISIDGKLVIGRGHSVLSDGCSVKFAGQLKFDRKGRLVEITNDSGHFKPPSGKGLTQKAKDYLDQLGIDVGDAEVVEVSG
ncbi:MAG: hypothetical protein KatS3mg111_2666 [Pirellulaceae bacterium]|nr:MAG: hypothetical protein KatS3mg111_2666 [Pirellulaceae bacterium]